MARNVTRALDAVELETAMAVMGAIAVGDSIRVAFTGRADGMPRDYSGTVVDMLETDDSTVSFKVETDKGIRSVNAYLVTNVEVMG